MDKGIEELLNNMKAAAEKATPGRWSAFIDVASSTYSVFAKKVDDVISWIGFDGRRNASNNAKFIALASPKNVLSMIAALEQAQQKNSIPDGWVLVPKEPTEEMITAAYKHEVALFGVGHADLGIYAAMLSAAPKSELEARPLCVKLPDELIDQVCLAAAEIHNRGDGVNDDKAQFIIDRIRMYLSNGGTVEGSE